MKYSVDMIRAFGEQVYVKCGLTPEDAAVAMDSMIVSDLRGIRTHGTTHLKGYFDRLRLGTAGKGSDIEIRETAPSSLVVDAKHAVGMPAAMRIMKRCIEGARKNGVCFATVKNACHYGFGGYYPMKAAEEGLIGFSISNCPATVAPFGGAEAMLGTNPISVAVPAGRYPSVVLDMATSVVAMGKIQLAFKEGKPSIPEGWALDKEGNPTTDPEKGVWGVLLPMGGPKGYGLGLIISLIVSAMAGGTQDKDLPRFWEEPKLQTSVGHFMGAIDISKFRPLDEFKKEVDEIIARMKSSRPAAGFKGVLIPGEIEYNLTQKNMAEGIELSDATLRDFREIAEALAIEYPF